MGNFDVVLGSIVSKFERMCCHVQCAQSRASEYQYVLALDWHHVIHGQFKHFLFGLADISGCIVHHRVFLSAQVAIIEGFVGRSCYLCGGNGLEPVDQTRDLDISFFADLIGETQGKLFGAATAGDDAHANFHQSNITLSSCHHGICVHGKLATAAKHIALCGDYYRNGRITDPHGGLLEHIGCHIQLVPVLFIGHHSHHHQVSAHRKLGRIVPDHDAFPALLLGNLDRIIDPAQDSFPNGVHFGVEFQAQHPVANIVKGTL